MFSDNSKGLRKRNDEYPRYIGGEIFKCEKESNFPMRCGKKKKNDSRLIKTLRRIETEKRIRHIFKGMKEVQHNYNTQSLRKESSVKDYGSSDEEIWGRFGLSEKEILDLRSTRTRLRKNRFKKVLGEDIKKLKTFLSNKIKKRSN